MKQRILIFFMLLGCTLAIAKRGHAQQATVTATMGAGYAGGTANFVKAAPTGVQTASTAQGFDSAGNLSVQLPQGTQWTVTVCSVPTTCFDALVVVNSTNLDITTLLTTAAGSGSGGVSSVAITVPSVFTATGCVITSTGTCAITFATGQTAHKVLGTGSGTSFGAVTLAAADLPNTLVYNNGANTFTTAGTLDLHSATSTAAFIFPSIAGCAPTTAGATCYDSTFAGLIFGTGATGFRTIVSAGDVTALSGPPSTKVVGIQRIAVDASGCIGGSNLSFAWVTANSDFECIALGLTTASGVTNTLSKYTSASAIGNSLATDDGTTFNYSGTGGISAVQFTSTGTGNQTFQPIGDFAVVAKQTATGSPTADILDFQLAAGTKVGGIDKNGAMFDGVDNSVAGTLTLANGSAAAHTIFASGATTSNTIKGFTVAPTTNNLVSCVVASTTCTLTDAGITASGNLFTNYGGSALVGRGVPSILGVANVTGSSATIGTTNLVASTPAAGHYRIQFYVDQGTACSNATAGSVLTTISWTDATAARVNTNNMLFTTSGSTTGPAGTAWVASTINVWAASASAITYATTYTACTTGTATYDLHAAVERLQ